MGRATQNETGRFLEVLEGLFPLTQRHDLADPPPKRGQPNGKDGPKLTFLQVIQEIKRICIWISPYRTDPVIK